MLFNAMRNEAYENAIKVWKSIYSHKVDFELSNFDDD